VPRAQDKTAGAVFARFAAALYIFANAELFGPLRDTTMKCLHCLALNAPTDTVCFKCRQELVEVEHTVTPQWAYLFAAVCGAIPIVSLGGLIPAVLGVGGAGGCLKVARLGSLPIPVRLLLCVGITMGSWILFALLLVAMMSAKASAKR
jgi:hypothetical protein